MFFFLLFFSKHNRSKILAKNSQTFGNVTTVNILVVDQAIEIYNKWLWNTCYIKRLVLD